MHRRAGSVIVVLTLLGAILCGAGRAYPPQKGGPRHPVQVVKVVKKRGFSWRDAGIGAATVGIGITVVAGVGLLLTRTHEPRTTSK
jgi:hypothetical protein